MNDGPTDAARELRRAFDESFARAVGASAVPSEDFLVVRLRGDPHLLRQREVARLLRLRGVMRYPSPVPAWLGLAAVAGAVVPVYDLAVLAGYAAADVPGWMILCADAPVALAFDAFEGHWRVSAETDAGAALADAEVLRVADETRPVVTIAALLDTVRSLACPADLPRTANHQEP
jgi:hypothetical protein